MAYLALWGGISAAGWWRAGLAFVLVAVLVPLARPLAERIGLIDRPGGRKQHATVTATHGGLAILLAMVAVAAVFGDLRSSSMLAFYFAGGLLLLVGIVDDLRDLNWRLRLGAQAVAALVMVYGGGVVVDQLSDVVGVPGLHLGWLGVPVTVFVVVGVINALNMADGLDGLAAGQALVSLLLFTCFALYAGNGASAERLLAAAAAVLGFLLWNLRRPGLPRARAFLGDAGSTVLGFVIAWTAIRLTQDPTHPVSPVLGPWTIALPLIDCVALIVRRRRAGHSPFAADRNHLHHLLLDAGYAPSAIALGLMALSASLGLAAAVALRLGVYRPLLVLAFLVLLFAYYRFSGDRARAVARLRALPLLRRWARAGAERPDGR